MNQHLQKIADFIQDDANLSTEVKAAIVKSLKDADKELEITAFKLDRTEKVKRTTAILLEETIEELEQKRKSVEAQNRELEIEAALEKVRSRTLAMQRSDELAETAAVLFRQLIALGIAPNRLYMGIINDEIGTIEFWITDEDGSKVSTMFTGETAKNISMKKMYDGWKQRQTSISIDMQDEELIDYFHYLGEELHVPFKDGLVQKRRIQYITYFSKGFIGIASPEEQPKQTIDLLERFSYVFNLTFTRFNDLKIAEAQAEQARLDLILIQTEKKRAEDALAELRITQTQLIQKEKLASLGELTAGIAHEIQNPLNFVNNFSEVSTELVTELEEEQQKPDRDTDLEAELLSDLKQNLQKITHHGGRASAIVKGMLEHSRASSGERQPVDLNNLADEYLRLAYHGLRAKDKSFNCELVTDFAPDLGQVSVMPADIGRVLLNLFNNAFYAVQKRQQQQSESYMPTVTVQTRHIDNRIEIHVRDNGTGIPDAVKAKIFQPFFTTKPTGEGTGLGLSLSYDIVTKGHGGMLTVDSVEGEGTEFTLTLTL